MHVGQQPNRGAGEEHQSYQQRVQELRDRFSSIAGITIPPQAVSFATDRNFDAMSTPFPPCSLIPARTSSSPPTLRTLAT